MHTELARPWTTEALAHEVHHSRSAFAERFSFTYEGIFRQHLIVKGRNRDTAWYAVIDQEWPALARAYRAWLDPANFDEAAAAYRRALEIDPYLVPALINLANIHYSGDEIAEAQALYERAIGLESDFFEAHFNLGNIYHDLGRFPEAQSCYREALRLNPFYADTHFYLAVTFEKMGLSQDARPHWRAYQQLAPDGEWVELAREFSE